jgi:3',5'-cyclic AMP phosphodiesterase CpdA
MKQVLWAGALMCAMVVWSVRARAEGGFVVAPYLQNVGVHGAQVMGRLGDSAPVSIDVQSANAPAMHQSAKGPAFAFAFADLQPATKYSYTVKAGGDSFAGSWTTAPDDARPLRFALYGDNRTDHAAHARVVAQMLKNPVDLLIHTGDMTTDGEYADEWVRFFAIERDLLKDNCMFPTIGNHEIADGKGIGAENYRQAFSVPSPPVASERWYSFRWGLARFFMMDAQDSFDGEQVAWLKKSLEAADGEAGVTYRFVVLHQSPYSSGLHGPNEAMVAAHVPEMLVAHDVDYVLAGHDHAYERGEANGLRYMVSGGGGAPLYSVNHHMPYQKKFESVHHFVLFTLAADKATLEAIRDDGSEVEKCSFAPYSKGTSCDAPAPATSASASETPARAPQTVPPARSSCRCDVGAVTSMQPGGWLALVGLAAWVRRRKSARV